MSARNASRQYAYIAEVTFGTTPGTPQTQLFEVTNFDGDMTAEQLTDPSIRSDRQTGFSRRGNSGTEGNIEFALCPDNYDVFLEAVTGGTWTTNVLKIGNTARSFAIEEGFTDIAQFRTFNGVTFNTLKLDVTPDKLVSGSFGFMGSATAAFVGTSIDTTPTAITAKDKFFHEGGTITEGGSAAAFLTGISFEMTNNIAGNYALGNTGYRSMSLGKVSVTGTVTALFESVTLYNKFKGSTDSAVAFTLAAGAETLNFNFPKVKYTSGKLTRGDSGPVLVELGFEAVYDTSSASSLVITRV